MLKENLSCADELCTLTRDDMGSIIGRKILNGTWNGESCFKLAQRNYAILEKLGINGVRSGEDGYPSMFSEIFDPPYMIFYRGDLRCLENKCVSIVGTRHLCSQCAKSTMDFASSCAEHGMTVVSGLANGVDTFAHKAALSVGGLTAAVLPCGIDTIMPKGNTFLATKILEGGGVLLSEYLPGAPSEKWRYVKRNRLIAALSSVVVVTQAPPGSGSLITADFALGYNRYLMFHEDCFCREAMDFSRKVVEQLKMKNNKAALGKIAHSSESYVRDGAPVFRTYEEFCEALKDSTGVTKQSGQIEFAF